MIRILPTGWLDAFGQNPLGIFDGVKKQIPIGHKRNSATDFRIQLEGCRFVPAWDN
jgi:hypothetical protein